MSLGLSNVGGFGAGMILASLDGVIAKQTLRFNFKTFNNEIEYKALLIGLRLACELKV